MEVKYYYGYISKLDKLNVYTIILSKYRYDLLVLHYDDYHEKENLFFILEEKEPFTIDSIKMKIKSQLIVQWSTKLIAYGAIDKIIWNYYYIS